MCDFLGPEGQEDVEETDATAGNVNQVSPSFPHNVKRSTCLGYTLVSTKIIYKFYNN